MLRNSSALPGPSGPPKKERKSRGWSMWNRGGSAHVTDSGATVLWLPYCSHRDRCVDSTEACKAECLRLVTELNREVSSHHSLALTLGGSGDNGQLRDELRRTRKRAQELAKQARLKLMPALNDQKLNERDRTELERLWYLYCCCICILEGDMQRSLSLLRLFSLHGSSAKLINTGLHEFGGICAVLHHKPVATVAAVAAMGGLRPPTDAFDAPNADKAAREAHELNQLHKEIVDLHEAVPELQKADSGLIDMKEWRQHFEQQQQQNAQNNGKTSSGGKENSGSNSDDSSDAESQTGGDREKLSPTLRRCGAYFLVALVCALVLTLISIVLLVLLM